MPDLGMGQAEKEKGCVGPDPAVIWLCQGPQDPRVGGAPAQWVLVGTRQCHPHGHCVPPRQTRTHRGWRGPQGKRADGGAELASGLWFRSRHYLRNPRAGGG